MTTESLFPKSAQDRQREDVRREMIRRGISPDQLRAGDDPEFGWIDPLVDTDTAGEVRRFIAAIWDDPLDPIRHLAPTRPSLIDLVGQAVEDERQRRSSHKRNS